jgi:heme oxygenase (biliverdin-IX-beta and delta-forming)
MNSSKSDEMTGASGVREMLRRAESACLASLMPEGSPYASLVNVASDQAGRPLVLISRLAWHTRNLGHDARASLLIADPNPEGDRLEAPRATLIGRFETVAEESVSRRYLALHPGASEYAGFADFSYWRLTPETVHLVAGFGRIQTFSGADLLIDAARAVLFAGIEKSAVEHMNADHDDAVALIWRAAGGTPTPAARVVAIDAEGLDLSNGRQRHRFAFGRLLKDGADLRHELANIAQELRKST